MRKWILSLTLIVVFTAYAVNARSSGPSIPPVILTNNNIPGPKQIASVFAPPAVRRAKSSNTSMPARMPMMTSTGKYKDGNYTGKSVNAYYGNVQVVAVVSGGKLTDVQVLDYPKDRQNSLRISGRALPILVSESISIQDSNVNTVSGASATSEAYRESLASALSQATA